MLRLTALLSCCAALSTCAGDHARVSDIVSEVEQRDLREATARLQQAAAGGSRMLPSDGEDSDGEDCTSCYVDDASYLGGDADHRRRSSAYEDS